MGWFNQEITLLLSQKLGIVFAVKRRNKPVPIFLLLSPSWKGVFLLKEKVVEGVKQKVEPKRVEDALFLPGIGPSPVPAV